MVATDRTLRKRSPRTDITPLPHRTRETALPERLQRAAMLAHDNRTFKSIERKETACMPSSQRSSWC
jgi:hypothetical protein